MDKSHINIIKEFAITLKIQNNEWELIKTELLPKLFTTKYSLDKEGLILINSEIIRFLEGEYIFTTHHIERYEKEARHDRLRVFIMGIILGLQ